MSASYSWYGEIIVKGAIIVHEWLCVYSSFKTTISGPLAYYSAPSPIDPVWIGRFSPIARVSQKRSLKGRPWYDLATFWDTRGYQPLIRTFSGQIERLTKEEAAQVSVFEDIISGKTFERPGLTALIDFARSGDTLAIIRLDRLGRSLKELLETVDALKAQNIGLISLEERIDTTSAAGELVFHVFGVIAHFERRLISERTKDGLAAAKKHGRNPGRPFLRPETISALQKLVAPGTSVSQAAKHLGIGRSTAYKAVSEIKQT